MSTSGTVTFSRNRDQLIKSALRKVSAFEAGETPDADSISDASDALNSMVKHWQGQGIHIWRTQEAILFLTADQERYTLGTGSSDRVTGAYTQTTTSAAAAIGASTISVTSATGIATTYNIGVQLDDGTYHWTTVNGAPSGTTVTLTAVLTDTVASGNVVLVYQTALVRPLRIISARRFNLVSEIETPLDELDRVEYQELPNKTASGSVTSFYYDRRGATNTTGYFYAWPSPDAADDAIKLTVARPIEDFSAAANDSDLPQEWIRALEWGLADEIADEYDVPEPKRTRIAERAKQFLDEASWAEKELISFQLVPDRSR